MFESVGVILEAGTDKQGDHFSEELLQSTVNSLNGDLALSFGKAQPRSVLHALRQIDECLARNA